VTFVSYAQNFEDVLLWRAFHDVEQGRYIDIGAQDPEFDSVSLAFYKAGWRGIHVEPTAFYANKLREARPDETVIEAAVTDVAGPIQFYELGGLSSGRKDIANHHKKSGHKPHEILVPTIRLDQLLELESGDIHWLKVDVEGMEADVLRSWGKSSKRPWVLVIESTFPNSQEPTEHLWIDQVLSRGYSEAFFDGLSRYFVHEAHSEISSRLNRPANVFDAYQVTTQHFSASQTRQEAETQQSASDAREAAISSQLAQARERIRDVEIQFAEARTSHDELLNASAAEKEQLAEQWKLEREARVATNAEIFKIALLAGSDPDDFSTSSDGLQTVLPGTTYAALKSRLSQVREELDRARDQAVQQFAAGQRSRDPEIEFLTRRISSLQNDVTEVKIQIGEALTKERMTEGRAGQAERDRARLQTQLDEQAAALGFVRAEAAALATRLAGARQYISSIHASRRGKLASWLNLLPPGPHAVNDASGVEAPAGDLGLNQPTQNADPAAQRYGMEIAVQDIRHTSNLLTLNGSIFVDALYRTFLKRSADRAGRDHFIGRLQSGHSKEAILLAVATSAEAKAIGAPVEGVADLERAQRRSNGWLFGGRKMRTLDSKLNRLEFSLGETHNALVDRLDRIETSVDQIRSASDGGGVFRNDAGRANGNHAAASIKRGLSIDPPASAPEFINGLRREVQASTEALALRKK
jgi:FkbM family methyltransferase